MLVICAIAAYSGFKDYFYYYHRNYSKGNDRYNDHENDYARNEMQVLNDVN